jgi:signal transduction histidine kinase
VEAVRASDWNAQTPPDSGWVEVSLPDNWPRRWPRHDGVVWYRLSWNESAPLAARGLLIESLRMAGAISVNGVELARDDSLVEPLSRMWNTPRYFLLAPGLLREGENVLLVRVSGEAPYGAGLGPVRIGDPAVMRAQFEDAWWTRRDLPRTYLVAGATLGCFFFVLWLMRRKESAYGWYAALQATWVAFHASNLVVQTTWPFANTHDRTAATYTLLLGFVVAHQMFVLRFCERRWPRREAALWIVSALLVVALLLTPDAAMPQTMGITMLYAIAVATLTSWSFVYFAWGQRGRLDQRILATVGVMSWAAGCFDGFVVMGLIKSSIYYATWFEQLDVVAVATVLAWNFVRNQRRIEGFNAELQNNVAQARAELATTLQRQHDLELVHARLGERVNLAHDLHDGLGGMLIGTINELEAAPENVPTRDMLDAFKDLRDDLRLIIDTATAQRYGELSLAQLLAPMRHRMARLFEMRGIDSEWRFASLDAIYLTSTQSLDLLRILQEALANVLKHSRATLARIELQHRDDALVMEVSDNGVGMPDTPPDSEFSVGLRSMRMRAQRLNATLSIGSERGTTVVRLHMPRWETEHAQADAGIQPIRHTD